LTVNNNDIQGNYVGNLSLYPLFTDTSFILDHSSPLIDAGLESELYNDIEDSLVSGNVLWPSQGKVRNDIGAYGGPDASVFASFEFINLSSNSVNFGNYDTIGKPVSKNLIIVNQSTISVHIDSIKKSSDSQVTISSFSPSNIKPMQMDTINMVWTPRTDLKYTDTLFIYHNLPNIKNPYKAVISGKASKPTSLNDITSSSLINIYPNPFKESAIFQFCGVSPNSKLEIFDLNGKVIRIVKIDSAKGSIILNRNEMTPGIYIYILKSEKSVLNGRFSIIE
jgi:hypothetical protein